MLKKAYRLPLSKPAPPLFIYSTPYFTAKVSRNVLPYSRFGFIVSKKVSPHAVERNRAKRQLRAIIEALLPTIAPGYDILFIVQKSAVLAEQNEVKTVLLRFLTGKALLT